MHVLVFQECDVHAASKTAEQTPLIVCLKWSIDGCLNGIDLASTDVVGCSTLPALVARSSPQRRHIRTTSQFVVAKPLEFG
jgi:hypothetical protein